MIGRHLKSVFIIVLLFIYFPVYAKTAEFENQNCRLKNKDGSSIEIVCYPDETKNPLFNKGYGLLYPTWKWKNDVSFLNSVKPYTDIAYTRFYWSQIEPNEGEFRFDLITDWIQKWKERGFSRFGFGVMSTAKGYQATPMWVFKAGVPGEQHIKNTQIDPVYWDELYLRKLSRFVAAMGEAFNGRKDIEFVEMRNIGVWGEMHFGFQKKGMWTRDELFRNGFSGEKLFMAYKSMISMYKKAFPDTELFLNIAPGKDAIVDYAVKNRVNLRFDGLNKSTLKASGLLLSEYFNTYGYFSKKADDKDVFQHLPDLLKKHNKENLLNNWVTTKGISASIDSLSNTITLEGTQSRGWSYILRPVSCNELTPGKKYRLEGMVKVDQLSNEQYPPFFKFQSNAKNNEFIINYFSHKYDVMAMGTWQKLWTEFKIGPFTKKGIVALEKGTTQRLRSKISLKNVRLLDMSQALVQSYDFNNPTAPNGVRCCYEFADIVSDIKDLDKLFTKAISDPISYINLNYRDEDEIVKPQEIDLIRKVASKIGSRFVLKKITYSFEENVDKDKIILSIHHDWENTGITPCFEELSMKFVIMNNDCVISEYRQSSGFEKLLPKKTATLHSQLILPKIIDSKTSLYLKISMVNKKTFETLKLPLGGYDNKGYYSLLELNCPNNREKCEINNLNISDAP